MNTAEFKIGDTVSFRAWKDQPHEGLTAKVVDVCHHGLNGTGKHLDGSLDNRVFYVISGPGVVSTTSGISIIESKLFQRPTE
jgi:hypothetical protein